MYIKNRRNRSKIKSCGSYQALCLSKKFGASKSPTFHILTDGIHSAKADQNSSTTALFPLFWCMYSIYLLNQIAPRPFTKSSSHCPSRENVCHRWLKAIWSCSSNSRSNKVAHLMNFSVEKYLKRDG